MGLCVSLTPNAGLRSEFYVDDVRVELLDMNGPNKFRLKVHAPALNSIYTITDKTATQILPGVRVSAGDNVRDGQVKVVIEAPRSVKLLRGKLYDSQRRNA